MARTLNSMSLHCFVIVLEKVHGEVERDSRRGIFGRKRRPFVMIYDIRKMAKEKRDFLRQLCTQLFLNSDYDINNNSKL